MCYSIKTKSDVYEIALYETMEHIALKLYVCKIALYESYV